MYTNNLVLIGNLVDAPEVKVTPSGSARARFRVASTERRRDAAAGTWTDGPSVFVQVTCWRRLAENVANSLEQGRPGHRLRAAAAVGGGEGRSAAHGARDRGGRRRPGPAARDGQHRPSPLGRRRCRSRHRRRTARRSDPSAAGGRPGRRLHRRRERATRSPTAFPDADEVGTGRQASRSPSESNAAEPAARAGRPA